MIKSIHIKDVATFGSNEESMIDLAEVNFVYGSNGTGKTTVSRIVSGRVSHPECSVIWKDGVRLETFVYNRDFVDENINQSRDLKGIFTLGEKNKEIVDRIEAAHEELEGMKSSVKRWKSTLQGDNGSGGKFDELKKLEEKYNEVFWRLKVKYEGTFRMAFSGVLNSKAAFKEKLLQEGESNNAPLLHVDELEKRAQTVFDDSAQVENVLVVPDSHRILVHEGDGILTKRVSGKSDVDIASLIDNLGNSDWVKEGRKYYDPNERICPFCQQSTNASLEKSLNDYFDESFRADSDAIQRLQAEYNADSEVLLSALQALLDDPSERLDVQLLENHRRVIEARVKLNLSRIEEKARESSNVIELESLRENLDSVRNVLNDVNAAIRDHNELVNDIHGERTALRNQVWRYLIDNEASHDLASYLEEKKAIQTAISSLEEKIANKTREIGQTEREIRELESRTTSIQPAIDGIDAILRSYGFLGFTLAQSARPGFYNIQRADGADAMETLSEGERSFIAFLYFYHLIRGSVSESGTTEERVVIFDDPVSSLDNNVLFVVSSLIKELFRRLRNNEGTVRQVFVLTHNAYFHKEVCFNSTRIADGRLKDETFWTIRKVKQYSKIVKHGVNPIRSTYEWLWMEIRREDHSVPTLPNTMRRILEHYFRILGDVNSDDVISHFAGHEQLVSRSLFSWVNEGSHSVYDDPSYTPDESEVEMYLGVFRRIFEETGHEGHYKMMMRDNANEAY